MTTRREAIKKAAAGVLGLSGIGIAGKAIAGEDSC